jgi:hypothetical protein
MTTVQVEFLLAAAGFLVVIVGMLGWIVVPQYLEFRRQGLNFWGTKRRRRHR